MRLPWEWRTQAARGSPSGDSKKEATMGFLSRNDWALYHIRSKSLRCRVLAAEVPAILRNPGQETLLAFRVRSASSWPGFANSRHFGG